MANYRNIRWLLLVAILVCTKTFAYDLELYDRIKDLNRTAWKMVNHLKNHQELRHLEYDARVFADRAYRLKKMIQTHRSDSRVKEDFDGLESSYFHLSNQINRDETATHSPETMYLISKTRNSFAGLRRELYKNH